MQNSKKFYFIAGEASGDILGGEILSQLVKELGNESITFKGVGGSKMQGQGLESLFSYDDLSVAGIGPVLAKLPTLIKRINQTVSDIIEFEPDFLVTIDAPDFCFRVAKKVRSRLPKCRFIHVVAPTVWAWRPSRAKKWKPVTNRILALFPFEPEIMAELGGPETVYIGHPLLASNFQTEAVKHNGQIKQTVLLLPGSRRQEIAKHLPFMKQVLQRLNKINDMQLILPTTFERYNEVKSIIKNWPWSVWITNSDHHKNQAFNQATIALAASGTVTLELAMANIPSIIIYKTSPLWWLIGLFSPLKLFSLPNIISGEEIYPEFVLQNARVKQTTIALNNLLDPKLFQQAKQKELLEKVHKSMEIQTPFAIAAVNAILTTPLPA